MNKEQIGTLTGIVWRTLNEKGPLSFEEMQRETLLDLVNWMAELLNGDSYIGIPISRFIMNLRLLSLLMVYARRIMISKLYTSMFQFG